jgi:hypothetical protein
MVISIETDIETNKDASGAVYRAQRKRMKDGAQYGLNHAVEKAPEDRGTLTQDLIDPEWRGDTLIWGFGANHAKPVNFGTEAYYPPVKPLLEWSERVTGDTGLGWYVAKVKIPTEGIEGQHFAEEGRQKQIQWYKSNPLSDYLDREL